MAYKAYEAGCKDGKNAFDAIVKANPNRTDLHDIERGYQIALTETAPLSKSPHIDYIDGFTEGVFHSWNHHIGGIGGF